MFIGIVGAGFLTTLILSRWISNAPTAVVLGSVLASATIAGFVALLATDGFTISIIGVLVITMLGAIIGRVVFDLAAKTKARAKRTDASS